MRLTDLLPRHKYEHRTVDGLFVATTQTSFGSLEIVSNNRLPRKVVAHVNRVIPDMETLANQAPVDRPVRVIVDATKISESQFHFLGSDFVPTHVVDCSSGRDFMDIGIWDLDVFCHEWAHIYMKNNDVSDTIDSVNQIRSMVSEPLKRSLSSRYPSFDNWSWDLSRGPGHYEFRRDYHLSDEELFARSFNMCHSQSHPNSKISVLNQPMRVDVLIERGYENGLLTKELDSFRKCLGVDFGPIQSVNPYFKNASQRPNLQDIHLELDDLLIESADLQQ